jgi:hypothetical protein
MSTKATTLVLLVIVVAFVLLPAVGMLLVGRGVMGPGMMRPGVMWGGWGIRMWSFGLLLAMAALAVLLAKRPSSEDPLVLLKQRLAKGEITKEQYIDLKATLQQP